MACELAVSALASERIRRKATWVRSSELAAVQSAGTTTS